MTPIKRMWMVRAQRGGRLFDEFKLRSLVAIGWSEMGDLRLLKAREDFTRRAQQHYPDMRPGQIAASASQCYRFVREFKIDDRVLTYSPKHACTWSEPSKATMNMHLI